MKQTFTLSEQQENTLEQIYRELLISLKKTWTEENMFELVCFITKECGHQTIISKKDKTVNFFKSVGKVGGKAFNSTKDKYNSYKNNGFGNELISDSKKINDFIKATPNKIKDFSEKSKLNFEKLNNGFLKKSKEEKLNLMASGVMSILIFYASAGGEDFEGGIPDLDLELGIGFHRNIFSHSIISGLIIEFLMRSGVEIINKSYSNLPAYHHYFWDKTNRFINNNKNLAIGSMWAGISVHLIQDAGLNHATTKPYTGVPFEMSMDAHQGLFAANGTASAIFAGRK